MNHTLRDVIESFNIAVKQLSIKRRDHWDIRRDYAVLS